MWFAAGNADLSDVFAAVDGESSGCPDRHPTGFLCDRPVRHPGRHIALGHHRVVAAWPGNHQPTLTDLEGDTPCSP